MEYMQNDDCTILMFIVLFTLTGILHFSVFIKKQKEEHAKSKN